MLFAASGLIGTPVAARDGRIGVVAEFLLDGPRWRVRWLVVDPGRRLPGRKVLIHRSAMLPIQLPERPAIPMFSVSGESMKVAVDLSLRQIEASPEAPVEAPVTRDLERRICEHYGWDPFDSAPPDAGWGGAVALKGFVAEGLDGAIGTVENALIDDRNWSLGYFLVATGGWLSGRTVQIPAEAATGIEWPARVARFSVTRERARSAPVWDPLAMVDAIAEASVRRHFGAP